jgi:hypothetical protein
MYRQVPPTLQKLVTGEVHLYDAKEAIGQAASVLAERADEVGSEP